MGGMMGTGMGAWIFLWVVLGLAVVITAGAVAARVARGRPEPPQVPPAESLAMREAKEALRLRYATGEISREEYLQGKVELED